MLIAESYGGKDEPVDTLARTFMDINIAPIVDPLRVKEEPSEATYQVRTRSPSAVMACRSGPLPPTVRHLVLPRTVSHLAHRPFLFARMCFPVGNARLFLNPHTHAPHAHAH